MLEPCRIVGFYEVITAGLLDNDDFTGVKISEDDLTFVGNKVMIN